MTDENVWNAHLLRLTVFPEPEYQSDFNWWKKVVGETHEVENKQPHKSQTQYEGIYQNGKLILRMNPSRIDWLYVALDEPENLGIPTIGLFNEVVEDFTSLMQNWLDLDTIPMFRRIAFGAVLHQSVDSLQKGYEILETKYLRFSPQFDENTSDFLYQVNRKVISQNIPDLSLNRLMKWSVGVSQTVIIMPTQRSLPKTHFVRLELDINSHQEFEGTINSKTAKKLLTELTTLGSEIADNGDIS